MASFSLSDTPTYVPPSSLGGSAVLPLTGPHSDRPRSDPTAAGVPAELWAEYDDITPVGRGGMGVVYKARHRRLGRTEAVKVVRAGPLASAIDLARFRYEAEATAQLDHPNIVPVYRVGEAGGNPYYAMKWVDGGELAAHAVALRADPPALARVLAKVARAVAHAHRHGILHRDLKPANVLVDTAGEPHVTDFGLAKPLAGPDTEAWAGLTATGVVVGTPHYIAPEQARGARGVTTSADVYGLGAILYEALTGRPPFPGASVPEVLHRVLTEPPIPPRAVLPGADRDLEAICLKCLEKDPADRYPAAAAVAADLERRAAGRPVAVRPTGLVDWLRQATRRRPDHYAGYSWEVKFWFGAIMGVAQAGVFAAVQLGAGVGWVWGVFLLAWAAGAGVTHRYMGSRFSRLPETEKHSMMIATGHILAHVGLALAYVPFAGPAAGALGVYPAQAVVSGLALFVIGTTHWGRFFPIGLAVIGLAPLLALCPAAAPLLYGAALTACMWYWAYAVKVTFGRDGDHSREAEPSGGRASRWAPPRV